MKKWKYKVVSFGTDPSGPGAKDIASYVETELNKGHANEKAVGIAPLNKGFIVLMRQRVHRSGPIPK